jgi:hypothetical protein
MKKLVLLVLVLGVVLGGASTVFADVPAPGGPFNTAFRVQNLGSADANCEFSFYNASGVSQYDSGALTPIPPGDSLYVYVPVDTSVADGMYSAVVSCDQDVAAVVNISDADSGASYSGVGGSEVADTLYAPAIYDNYYNYYTDVVVQNASSGAINITLDIYQPGVASPVYSNTKTNVAANASVTWEQEGLAQLATNQFYSAKITGTGAVAAIVNIYGKAGYDGQLYSYNAFSAGSTTAYAPVIMNNYYGYYTALVVQNMGTATANVTITYSDAGTGSDWSGTIAAGAAESHYAPSYGIPTGQLLGAKVVSDQPVAVIVNESTNKNRAAAYNGFAAGSTGARAPVVLNNYYRLNSSVTCQNIGTSSATMTISYAGTGAPGGSFPSSPASVPPDGVGLFYQPSHISTANFVGSATITSDQPMVCVVNQNMDMSPEKDQVMDQLYAYNGIVD